jgi:hypothetical protein
MHAKKNPRLSAEDCIARLQAKGFDIRIKKPFISFLGDTRIILRADGTPIDLTFGEEQVELSLKPTLVSRLPFVVLGALIGIFLSAFLNVDRKLSKWVILIPTAIMAGIGDFIYKMRKEGLVSRVAEQLERTFA